STTSRRPSSSSKTWARTSASRAGSRRAGVPRARLGLVAQLAQLRADALGHRRALRGAQVLPPAAGLGAADALALAAVGLRDLLEGVCGDDLRDALGRRRDLEVAADVSEDALRVGAQVLLADHPPTVGIVCREGALDGLGAV